MIPAHLLAKYRRLLQLIKDLDSVVVAYSGGVDSTLVAYLCQRVLGERSIAVTAQSETYPVFELVEAIAFARGFRLNHRIIKTSQMANPLFSGNPENRCYYCKSELFKKLRVIADKEGVANVVDGTTLSDAGDYRPGRQAAKESGARSPLLETGLGKEEVRAISQFLGLPTAAKPAYACLASRFPYGEEITTEKLKMVGEAEDFLRTLGFQIIRVRHHREIARIEVACEEMTRLADPDTRDRIIQKFHSLGYLYVTIDLEGYRSGSMNKKIANAVRPDVYRGATAEMESRDNIGSYLTCPRCLEEQLKEMVTPEVHYFQCSHCGGIWFGLNELEKALGKNAKFTMPSGVDATEYLPRAAKPACPVCQTALVRIKALDVPDLEVDACLVCQGRWVDGREISRHQKQGLFTHLKDFVMRLF